MAFTTRGVQGDNVPKKVGRPKGSKNRTSYGVHSGGMDPTSPNTLLTVHQYCKVERVHFLPALNTVRKAGLMVYSYSSKNVEMYKKSHLDEVLKPNGQPALQPDDTSNVTDFNAFRTPAPSIEEGDSLDRKRELECERIRLDIDIKLGKYVAVETVKSELFGLMKLIQQRLMIIYPRSLPNKLVNQSVRDMQAILAAEGKAFLSELIESAPTILGNDLESSDSDGAESISVG